MLKATTVDQMDEAMTPWVDPRHNFLFADLDGSIAYLNRGVVSIRTMDTPCLPLPGWSGVKKFTTWPAPSSCARHVPSALTRSGIGQGFAAQLVPRPWKEPPAATQAASSKS